MVNRQEIRTYGESKRLQLRNRNVYRVSRRERLEKLGKGDDGGRVGLQHWHRSESETPVLYTTREHERLERDG